MRVIVIAQLNVLSLVNVPKSRIVGELGFSSP
jgi:hypothetical protein